MAFENIIVNFGFGMLLLTMAVALYGVGAVLNSIKTKRLAWLKSARIALMLTFPLITLSVISLLYLLVNNHFEVLYVYNVISKSMPVYLKVTALWGGQPGSLLFWAWTLSTFVAAVMLRRWDRDREFLPWVILVSLLIMIFFLILVIFVENPFTRIWQVAGVGEVVTMFPPDGAVLLTPRDGNGLNPLLRHPGMIIHPPTLYLGFVAFVIPYAFAMAALITRRTDDRWIRVTRRWTLVAWLFLSLGLVLGSRWAYDVLGWGGYWGWDPVEIAALMPWLSGTAFLHSVMIQEKRGMFKRWNMVLIILTYSLVIFGTFLTRSGVFSSVHAFSQSAIGPLFFIFITISFLVSLGLLLWRWNDLRSESQMNSLLSRESLFLFNNLLFMGILAVCFWGVVFPLISELFTGQKVTVGPPFYERATGPLFAGLLLLMGVAPLSVWGNSYLKILGRTIWKPAALSVLIPVSMFISGVRSWAALLGYWLVALVLFITLYEYGRAAYARTRSKGENIFAAFWKLAGRNRRRYGGYIIHIGIILMAMGVLGIELFQVETQGTVERGESLTLQGYTITYKSLSIFDTDDGRNVARAVMEVKKDGISLDELYPRRDYYYDAQQQMTIPGVRSTLEDDLYIILVDWQPVTLENATFKVYHNPLINWLWIGSLVFIAGTLVAAWPDGSGQRKDRV